MINIVDKELMLKFLQRSFPVYRLKHEKRFRRAIVLETSSYALSDKNQVETLTFNLMKILKVIFDTDSHINKDVLKTFLHLKS